MTRKSKSTSPILISDPTNIRYLTGFAGVASAEREAYVLLADGKTYFFTNALYLEETKHLNPIQISRENPIEKALKKVKLVTLEFEETNLTVYEYEKLKKALEGVTLVPTKNTVEQQRMNKNPKEIESIRLAANITDQCFKFITSRIKPGITEARLALEIEGYLRFQAGQLAFSPIVAFNENSALPHYQGRSHNPLRRGSLILLDFGAAVNGHHSDMTRVVFFGPPKDEWVRSYAAVLQAQTTALEYLKEGRSGAEADRRAQEELKKAGLPVYPHGLGHGVGLAIHEAPRLSIRKDETLTAGMVVTVEPGVYKEGSYGIRIEDLILLKKDGIELLSKSPKEMMIL